MGIRDLRESRKPKPITKTQLAEMTGINRVSISKYELGTMDVGNMTLTNALKILRATGHGRTATTVERLLLEGETPKENTGDE